MRLRQIPLLLLMISFASKARGQAIPDYTINATLLTVEKQLQVNQKIIYTHSNDFPTKTIILNDWNHAYSSTESPLAKRLVEEYNRSFYLSKKSKRGQTIINEILINGQAATWKRIPNQIDLIQIDLKEEIQKGAVVKLQLNYALTLPDAKFTGYGIKSKTAYFLENSFIKIALQDTEGWTPISHLDLEDTPHSYGNYTINFTLPQALQIETNLAPNQFKNEGGLNHYSFRGKNRKQLLFELGETLNFKQFNLDEVQLISNIESNELNKDAQQNSLEKVHEFLIASFGKYPHKNVLLSQHKYEKRPFYGLTLIPDFLKPFPAQFEFEIKALNTYLYHYLTELLPLHPRKDFWLTSGLHTYLMMRYVSENYPNRKLLGLVLRQPIAQFLLKKYAFKDLSFEETFIEYHEFVLRRNLQQVLTTPKEELIKFNEQIGTPSQMGLLLNYAVEFDAIDLVDFVQKITKKPSTGDALKLLFYNQLENDVTAFYRSYSNSRRPLDLKFNGLTQQADSVRFNVTEKGTYAPDFSIGLIRDGKLINEEKFRGEQLNTPLALASEEADFIVINPTHKLPEVNPRNNWKKLTGLKLKPWRFTFVKDLENPQYNQVFYNPRINFNAYDGLSFGIRLNNKSIKTKPFIFTLEPFYATLEESLVGSFLASYTDFNSESDYYLRNINFTGSSFHYDTNLRYSSIFGAINIYKRNKSLRDNKKELFRLFWQYIDREENSNAAQNPNYSLTGFNYILSNKGALDYFTLNAGVEAGEKFGKINLTTEYRHLMRSGRQISLRLFAGMFLWRNNLSSNYFDFALDRPTDYLFQYNYIGRSETLGIYSQQFIPAEGGFKSRFDKPFSDNFLLTLNTSVGLWKWIEAYGDIGYINQGSQKYRLLFDSGLRLNLVPDFLELYFPVFNSNGLQVQGPDYLQKMRYVITLDPRALTQLFSRKWF